ncbi:hypothetical protein DASC09_023470 [Saccharomycopsis crataegensis]|uniref:Centromere protein H C-terminal domain-containing protein n=1 Tax=Saccharomycopsis crataegensis TaxID=43959 RepID=A0AAV5QJP7_9ASCO|nr:hypothetical protein DASC09_023470 [Saccharomycopsis crataegensis]
MVSSTDDSLVNNHRRHAKAFHDLVSTLDELMLWNHLNELSELTESSIENLYETEVIPSIDNDALSIHNLSISEIITEDKNYDKSEMLFKTKNTIKVLENMIITRNRLNEISISHASMIAESYDQRSENIEDFQGSDKSGMILKNLIDQREMQSSHLARSKKKDEKEHDEKNTNGSRKTTGFPNSIKSRSSLAFENSCTSVDQLLYLQDENRKLYQNVIEKSQSLKKLNKQHYEQKEKEYRESVKEMSANIDAQESLKLEIKQEQEELARSKVRSAVLSEFITALIASSGVNWSDDDFVKDLVLYCGQEYVDEEDEDYDEDESDGSEDYSFKSEDEVEVDDDKSENESYGD